MATTMTRADLQRKLRTKVAKASPATKRHFYALIKSAKRSRLQTILKKVRVTKDGDINMT